MIELNMRKQCMPSRPATRRCLVLVCLLYVAAFSGCFPVPNNPLLNNPRPGPDEQGSGTIYGAMLGAGAGAVTGAQMGAGAGPGAWVGAGVGAVWGMFSGLGIDLLEEDQLRRLEEEQRARELAWVQEVLAEHYRRRLELHPNREIFPADLFFQHDSTTLRPEAEVLLRELALLMKRRMPWSRLVITAYVTSSSEDSPYAAHLTQRRAEEISTEFVRAGVEARRLTAKGVILANPLVLDPYDSPHRYRQAIEFVALDR